MATPRRKSEMNFLSLKSVLFIGQGIFLTMKLMFGAITIGLLLGSLISVLRYNKFFGPLVKAFISVIRGTPLILQLSLLYFAMPGMLGIKLSVVTAGIITFGLNSSAYVAEIFRSGIESIPAGQFEAAQTLQIPKLLTWKDIILPQVAKRMLPSLTGEIIALIKETAIISTIGGMDLMRRAQSVAAEQFTFFEPILVAGIFYYIVILLIELIGKKIENGWKYAKNN